MEVSHSANSETVSMESFPDSRQPRKTGDISDWLRWLLTLAIAGFAGWASMQVAVAKIETRLEALAGLIDDRYKTQDKANDEFRRRIEMMENRGRR